MSLPLRARARWRWRASSPPSPAQFFAVSRRRVDFAPRHANSLSKTTRSFSAIRMIRRVLQFSPNTSARLARSVSATSHDEGAAAAGRARRPRPTSYNLATRWPPSAPTTPLSPRSPRTHPTAVHSAPSARTLEAHPAPFSTPRPTVAAVSIPAPSSPSASSSTRESVSFAPPYLALAPPSTARASASTPRALDAEIHPRPSPPRARRPRARVSRVRARRLGAKPRAAPPSSLGVSKSTPPAHRRSRTVRERFLIDSAPLKSRLRSRRRSAFGRGCRRRRRRSRSSSSSIPNSPERSTRPPAARAR